MPRCSVSGRLCDENVIILLEGQKPPSVITKEHIPLSCVPGVLNKPTCRDPLLEEWITILRRIGYQFKKFTNDWLWKQLLLQGHPCNNFYSPEFKNSYPQEVCTLGEGKQQDYSDPGTFITSNVAYTHVTAENKVMWMKAFIIITIYICHIF